MSDISLNGNKNINQERENEFIEAELFTLAEYRHEEAEKITYSNYSYWKSTFITFTKNKIAVTISTILLLVMVFAFIQPYLPNQFSTDKTPYLTDPTMWKNPPSSTHWFGTNETGRDLWALVWAGTRISIKLALLVAVVNIIVGLAVGAVWGYVKKIDRLMTEIYNIISNIPSLVLYILFSYILSPGFWTIVLVMTMFGWLGMAKYVRNQVFIIRDREYNMASKCLGTPVLRMVFKNLVPHLVSVVILNLALAIPGVIGTEIMLTYLGVGLPVTEPSLGALVNAGRSSFTNYPHLLFFPVLIVALITISFYIVGNAFSDASDPRNHA